MCAGIRTTEGWGAKNKGEAAASSTSQGMEIGKAEPLLGTSPQITELAVLLQKSEDKHHKISLVGREMFGH